LKAVTPLSSVIRDRPSEVGGGGSEGGGRLAGEYAAAERLAAVYADAGRPMAAGPAGAANAALKVALTVNGAALGVSVDTDVVAWPCRRCNSAVSADTPPCASA